MPLGAYSVLIDWTNSGLFDGANDDVTGDVIDMAYSRGRDRASTLGARSSAGSLEVRLRNRDGKYNSFQTSSPLSGQLLPGRRVKVLTDDAGFTYTFPFVFNAQPLWTGYLDTIEPAPRTDRQHEATLRALGPFSRLTGPDKTVNVSPQTSVRTDVAIGAVLDAIGYPTADRDLATGQTTISLWWVEGVEALAAIQDIVETEGGFLRETADGKVKFEDRHYRLTGARLTSKASYSDVIAATLLYMKPQQGDPIQDVYNVFRATVRRQAAGGLATLWTLGESGASSPAIGPGESRTWTAQYPQADTALGNFGVSAWTTPVATTDYTANSQADGGGTNLTGNMAVSVVKGFTSMDITITNNASVTAYITLLQARGTPLVAAGGTGVQEKDTTSIAKYGEREYPVPASFLSDTDEARDYLQWLKAAFAEPIPNLLLEVDGNVSEDVLEEILVRDVSDRVTILSDFASDLGISEDYFVERKVESIDRFRRHLVRLELSPVSGFAGYLVWDTSVWGTDSALAY